MAGDRPGVFACLEHEIAPICLVGAASSLSGGSGGRADAFPGGENGLAKISSYQAKAVSSMGAG
jgi:hypothetical protein